MVDKQSVAMPRYRCHKEVSAIKIATITFSPLGDALVLTPVESGVAPVTVGAKYVNKHNPRAGGYYVRYEDGYESFSPADAFESGYTRITD